MLAERCGSQLLGERTNSREVCYSRFVEYSCYILCILICVYWWFACHSGQEIHFVCLQLSKMLSSPFLQMSATVLSVTAGEGGEVLRNG